MTLAQLIELARRKADETSSGYISDSTITSLINQGLRMMYGKVAQRFEDYFIQVGTSGNGGLISVTSGTTGYNLPTDLLKIVRVESRRSGSTSENDWQRVEKVNIGADQFDQWYPVREGYLPAYGYYIAGNKIYIKPEPAQAFSLRLWYLPRVTALSATTDEPGIPSEYHELLSEYAAVQILGISGEPIFKEREALFMTELTNMLETLEFRDQGPEIINISDDNWLNRYGV